jgi:hypothetical protein
VVVEAAVDRQDAAIREESILARKEADQVEQAPKRVIDRRRRQQQHVARTVKQETTQYGRSGRCVRVPIVVRLIDDDELILATRALQVFFGRVQALDIAKLNVVGKLFVRDALDGQIELPAGDKLLPRRIAKLRRADKQAALPA